MKKIFFLVAILLCGFCYGQRKIPLDETFASKYESRSNPKSFIDFQRFLPNAKKNHYSFSEDLSTSVQCIGNILTSPLRWNGVDGLKASAVIIGVAGSFLLDDEVRSLVLQNESSFNEDVLVRTGHPYSTVLYVGPAALVFYLSGAVFEDIWIRRTGQMLVEAVITTGIIQIPLSITIGRARPFFNEGNSSFKLFEGTDDNRASFFSGHSMIAFSFSTILSGQIDNMWASIGLYTLAVLGPFARLYKDKHWFSDTVLGSVLGIYTGKSILNWHQGNEKTKDTKLNIFPLPHGISITWVF